MAGEQDEKELAPKDASLVDESLLDAMLALSPIERLRQNDRIIRGVVLLRGAVSKASECDDGRR